jgi:DNA topoisomerase-3
VKKAEKKTATEKPPLLYDLTELQRHANSRFGFTAERTLRAAQSLYEGEKLITYPRTSSRYLSGDMIGGLKKRVEAAGGLPELSPFARELLDLPKLPITRRIVDDSKVTDHHAIVPRTRSLRAACRRTRRRSTTWWRGASWPCSSRRPASRTRPSSPR